MVDGNDVVAVWRTTREAVERAREGDGPVLIEAKTMRMTGHAQHDAAEYVPREMFEYWKARDPLDRCTRNISARITSGTRQTKAEIDARIERELAEDLEFAENFAFSAAETSRARRLLRRLPHGRSAMAAAQRRSDAAESRACTAAWTVQRSWRRSKPQGPSERTGHPGAGKGPGDSRGRRSPISKPFAKRCCEEMDRDPAVVLLGEDIGVYGGAFKVTAGLLERFGWERVIDTPHQRDAPSSARRWA